MARRQVEGERPEQGYLECFGKQAVHKNLKRLEC